MKNLSECISENVRVKESDLNIITSFFESRTLDKGEYLLKYHRECREMAFIESGYLRMFDLADGNEITLWIGSSGSFITSLSSFVLKTPNYWNIQAVTDASLQIISRENHFKLLEEVPKWLEFDNMILTRAFAMLEQRMFAHLHTTARERYRTLLQENPEVFNHVPLQYIASMLGIKPETLSRLRNQRANSIS